MVRVKNLRFFTKKLETLIVSGKSSGEIYGELASYLSNFLGEEPEPSESLEAFIDRKTAQVELSQEELSNLEVLAKKYEPKFALESKNLDYLRRRAVLLKFIEIERAKRLEKWTSHEKAVSAERKKIQEQLGAGDTPQFDSSLISDADYAHLRDSTLKLIALRKAEEDRNAQIQGAHELFQAKLSETELIKTQLESGLQPDYDKSIISLTEFAEIKSELKTARSIWLRSRVRPHPHAYGVSNYGAEHLVGEWLQYLGLKGVEVTSASNDGGFDVITQSHICQVKNYVNQQVSVQEVRELFGVAVSTSRQAMLFTSSTLTKAAFEFAEVNNVAAIQYNVFEAVLVPLNEAGAHVLETGQYRDG